MEEEKMFELLTSVKNMVKTDPAQARNALTSHPNLAYALMKEMVVLDVVDPEVLTRTLQAATGVQPPQPQVPQPPPQQTQQNYPPSNGTGAYPPYPAPGSTPTYSNPPQAAPYQQPPSSTPSYATPTYPSTSTPTYPPNSAPSYPPNATPSYPPNYPPQPPQNQPPAQSIPPHMYQARQQQQQQQQPQQTPPQSRPPPAAPAPAPGMGAVPGLAPEQQAMVQRLALLTPDQIAALPPADRAALIELRRQLGLE